MSLLVAETPVRIILVLTLAQHLARNVHRCSNALFCTSLKLLEKLKVPAVILFDVWHCVCWICIFVLKWSK